MNFLNLFSVDIWRLSSFSQLLLKFSMEGLGGSLHRILGTVLECEVLALVLQLPCGGSSWPLLCSHIHVVFTMSPRSINPYPRSRSRGLCRFPFPWPSTCFHIPWLSWWGPTWVPFATPSLPRPSSTFPHVSASINGYGVVPSLTLVPTSIPMFVGISPFRLKMWRTLLTLFIHAGCHFGIWEELYSRHYSEQSLFIPTQFIIKKCSYGYYSLKILCIVALSLKIRTLFTVFLLFIPDTLHNSYWRQVLLIF